MARTLLLGPPEHSWRTWLKNHLGERPLIDLDPADPSNGPAGFCRIHRGGRVVNERLFGSLDAVHSPHILIATLGDFLADVGKVDFVLKCCSVRMSPLARQTIQKLIQLGAPNEVVFPEGEVPNYLFASATMHECPLEPAMPAGVVTAQRKAQWIAMLEKTEEHTLDLAETRIDGTRFGSGTMLSPIEVERLGFADSYAETCGKTLMLITDRDFEDRVISRALDVLNCSRVHFASPLAYEGLVCAFARPDGTQFGKGRIREINFATRRCWLQCTAIPPVPVPLLMLGSIRIDEKGNELGGVKPWSL